MLLAVAENPSVDPAGGRGAATAALSSSPPQPAMKGTLLSAASPRPPRITLRREGLATVRLRTSWKCSLSELLSTVSRESDMRLLLVADGARAGVPARRMQFGCDGFFADK